MNETSLKSIDDVKQIQDILCFIKLICFYYSDAPNETLKKKYYELLLNIPIYYPNDTFSKEYLMLLDANPLSSFLDCRTDLLHWCHYIESQILKKYGRQTQNYASWILDYNSRYEKPHHYDADANKHFLYNEYVFYGVILATLVGIIKFNM